MKTDVKQCPVCGADSTVIDSRIDPQGRIRRRRKCEDCGFRYTTLEVFADVYKEMERRNGHIETTNAGRDV